MRFPAVIVIVLFLLVLLGASYADAVSSAVVAVAQSEPTVSVNPTLPPSPTPYCPRTAPNRLIVYERGRVTRQDPSPLNLRTGAGTIYEIIGTIPIERIFFVLEGPRCSERYAWYRVQYDDLVGWIAEGTGSTYFVEPYLPG
jgi:hypothetical protein